MFNFLRHALSAQNQFASGGLLLMAVGSMGVFLRAFPRYAWSWLVEQCTMTVTVKNEDAAFQWVKEWFLEQRFVERVRRVDLDTTLQEAELALMPAPGTHWFWYASRPFTVYFHRGEETKGNKQRQVELLTFRTLGRRRRVLEEFVSTILACHRKRTSMASRLHVFDEYWASVQAYSPRMLESVILQPGEKERLLGDLERFRAARERYRRLGVPYHRGYLLYGPPGTGKTSLVSGLAARFGMGIYVLNLTELNDRSLKAAVNDVPEDSVILFEDIDCMKTGTRRSGLSTEEGGITTSSGVTLSGLLNVLDGFHAPENVVFVMTANHAEVLDPALLRPGRIDYKLRMGEAAEYQKVELYRRFFSGSSRAEAIGFAQAHQAQTMAEFQGLLLRLEQGSDALWLETAGVSE